MKIKPEHFQHILNKIKELPVTATDVREKVTAEGKAKDIEKRVRWDLLWMAGLSPFICSELYPYLNDDHIDTALKAVVRQLD